MKSLFIILFFIGTNIRSNTTHQVENLNSVDVIIDIDRKLNKLIYEGNSLAAAAYYHDDFLLVTSNGVQRNKQEILSQISLSTLKMQINETLDPKVRIAGGTAVLTGILHQKYTLNGKQYDYMMFVTDTWVKMGNEWLLFSGQATLVN
jgi:ketosteroid isomerase-like protein